MNKFVFFCFILTCHSTFGGGDRVGNGGQAVVCKDNRYYTYFYDSYELVTILKSTIILPEKIRDPFEIAKAIVHRQTDKNTACKNFMLAAIEDMNKNLVFRPDNLVLTDDNANPYLKPHCRIVQAALAQREKGIWTYYLYQGVWDSFDRTHQAALILHEVLYRMAFELGFRSSLEVKMLNQALLSEIDSTQTESFFQLRESLGVLLPNESSQKIK